MYEQAAGEVRTAAGMPSVLSTAASASAGQARPAGASSFARSTASDQVGSMDGGQPSMGEPVIASRRSA